MQKVSFENWELEENNLLNMDKEVASHTEIFGITLECLDRGNPVAPQSTVKILKIGTPEIITIIVLRLEHLDFTVQYCVQKMQTE